MICSGTLVNVQTSFSNYLSKKAMNVSVPSLFLVSSSNTGLTDPNLTTLHLPLYLLGAASVLGGEMFGK